MADTPEDRLRVIQIGASTSDLPGSVRLFCEAFGFRNAGSNMLWGKTIEVQGLPPESRAMVWWMVGAQDFFQLEFFSHTHPPQRPKPDDWRPSDHGWSRFGVAVHDFDACLAALATNGVTTITQPIGEGGSRRVAFVEPFMQSVVEVFEKAELSSGEGPEVVYVASSVADLESARFFYRDTLGLTITDDNGLHSAEHESLWGLAGAERKSFLARGANQILLEIVQYEQPVGRPHAPDHRICDQGIMNICAGSRDARIVKNALDRATAAGITIPLALAGDGTVCAYLVDPDREVELTAVPVEVDGIAGFAPSFPFLPLLFK